MLTKYKSSMPSNEIVKVKRANKPPAEPESLSQPTRQPEIDQPEQPDPIVHLESLAEPSREESVYGSGWSVTQLMHEFSSRSSG